MLGHVQAIDAGLLGGLGEGEALVEQGGERTLPVLDVIEKSDFHQVLAGGVKRSVNLRFGNLPLAGEEIEIAAFVGLADMGGEHGAVAAQVAWSGRFPGRTAAVELLLRDVE